MSSSSVEFDSLQRMVSGRNDLCMYYRIDFCMQLPYINVHFVDVVWLKGINIYTLLGMPLLFLLFFLSVCKTCI